MSIPKPIDEYHLNGQNPIPKTTIVNRVSIYTFTISVKPRHNLRIVIPPQNICVCVASCYVTIIRLLWRQYYYMYEP